MPAEQYPKIYLYQRIVQAKLFIDHNYADNLDLNNISDEAYFSKYHFIRLFKKVYGKTPHQYLTTVRIDKAQQLLQTEVSVSETCYRVGFDSLSSFSSLFKSRVGVTPTYYIAQHQQLKAKILLNPLQFIPGCYAYQNAWTKNSNFEEVN